ncbi:L,D-transpeptidase family protein [Candidatus Pelagibacter sp. Uisw_099_02]|jgi:L,D-peptidoglycan transpeptidase YkuD (ErfK/YbiS/YcfS/YnhG family)|uniref:L,D-transpeptidase family protein n=1 Tax=Candidatus Pelagibacter sp. Uisw_099_02 TaxID=3230981 RepID=UPI00236C60A6|nr:L,D-transpeptidase family protein [Candidatus Pelagibacter sp.]
MIIHVKNKNTLIIDDFRFKCCVGKNGLNSNKIEGDYSTPKGLFKLEKLYFRKDRVGVPQCKIAKKIIKKNIAWCDDPKHKKYNSEILKINKKNKENFYRKDHIYDYLITISHNSKKIPYKGSAIFIHITNSYKPTAGCIALKKKDFEIILKLINQKTQIKID